MGGIVDADERAFRETIGYRDQISATGTTQFQHTALIDQCRCQSQ
jgi:hypothetical protein